MKELRLASRVRKCSSSRRASGTAQELASLQCLARRSRQRQGVQDQAVKDRHRMVAGWAGDMQHEVVADANEAIPTPALQARSSTLRASGALAGGKDAKVVTRAELRWSDQRLKRLKRRLLRHEDDAHRSHRRESKVMRTQATAGQQSVARIGNNVYELLEVAPMRGYRCPVLMKQDPGANVTLVDPSLYHHGIRHGYISNDRALATPMRVKGVAGSQLVHRVADMEVRMQGHESLITIQIYPNPTPMERAHQVLFGTDNSHHLGAVVDVKGRQTVYKAIPGLAKPLEVPHLDSDSAQRQFIAFKVGNDEVLAEEGEFDECSEQVPTSDDGSDVNSNDWRWKDPDAMYEEVLRQNEQDHGAQRCTQNQEAEWLNSISAEELELANRHLNRIERSVHRGDVAEARRRLATMVDTNFDNLEYDLMAQAADRSVADAHEVELSTGKVDSSGEEDLSNTIQFEVSEDGSKVKPVSDLNAKSQGDRAGTGWVQATRAEIKAHLIAKSDCMTNGQYLNDELISALHKSSQPPTEQLPAVTNHYVFIRLKPDAVPFRASARQIPQALMGRLQKIVNSMVELDVMEPTDHAINTMPVTLVLAKNDKGETTISRFCIDARQLNKQILDTTPECVPSLNQVLGHAQGAYVYSTFDTVKAFWTSKLWPPDAAKACLNVAGQNFILKRLFFGLKTGSSQFHALMTEIINKKTYSDGTPVPGMQGKDFTTDLYAEKDGLCLYIDDVVAYSRKGPGDSHDDVMKRHAALVTRFVTKAADRNLTLSVQKSHLFMSHCDFLGWRLGRDGLSIPQQKMRAFVDAPFPDTPKTLHTFIGVAVFFQRCLRCNLAELLSGLRKYVVMRATDKKYLLDYDPTCPEVIAAVEAVKERVQNAATLHTPDPSKEYHLWTDGAQSRGAAACLSQWVDTGPAVEWEFHPDHPLQRKEEGRELKTISGLDTPNRKLVSEQLVPDSPVDLLTGKRRVGYYAPIAFYSKSLQKQHRRWTSHDVELFAIVAAFRAWEPILLGAKTVVHTDCKALTFLQRQKDVWGRVGRWAGYLSLFEWRAEFTEGRMNSCADYLSRCPIPDPYVSFDGEKFRDKLLSNAQGKLQFTERNVPPQWLDNSVDTVEAEKDARMRQDRRPTLYSVCSGIGSSLQANEKARLGFRVLGMSEIDEDASEQLQHLYPDVPNHGDVRQVISALETGELVLKPDVVEMSMPCQSRSKSRMLAEWSEEQHPHHILWLLQPKLVSLLNPKVVLIENVPWREGEAGATGSAAGTKQQYAKLQAAIEALGYTWTERNDVNCSEHGDHTSRERFFAVATRKDVAKFEFPAPQRGYKGFWHLLEREDNIRRQVRCTSQSKKWVAGRGRWKKLGASPFQSEQIGFVVPQDDRELKYLASMRERFAGLRNPKGFRVYLPRSPAPTIMAYGREETCGPGKHTQFIMDREGNIRTLSVREAASIHGFTERTIASLEELREATAFRMIGNSVPVGTMTVLLRGIKECLQRQKETVVQGDSLEAQQGGKETERLLRELVYPTDSDMVAVQSQDPALMEIRSQLLQLSKKGGEMALKKLGGVSQARIMELSQYCLDESAVLLHSPTMAHYYDAEGEPCDENYAKLSPTSVQEDRLAAMVVVPKELQHDICYLNHYSKHAGHPQWGDMVARIRAAGYTWSGIKASCKRMCDQCKVCFQATRARSHQRGLFTSRRYRRPFEAISWDFQVLGVASENNQQGLLTIMCEHTGFCELYSTARGEATAEVAADALVRFCLRWGTPDTIWAGRDTQLNNSEVVARVCKRLGIKSMMTSAYDKNALGKQERKHLLINQILKRLHEGHPERWDEQVPVAEHRLRNTTLLHTGYTPAMMVFGREPKVPSPRGVQQIHLKKHPRAEAYMAQLQHSLGSIWRDVDLAGVLEYQRSFATLNAGRKQGAMSVGNYVMHYQPVIEPGSPSKLVLPWCGPFRVQELVRSKNVRIRHIVTGVERTVQMDRVTTAPVEESPGDYDAQYSMVRHLESRTTRLGRDYQLEAGEFVVVRTGVFHSVGQVIAAFADGSAHVNWLNSSEGDARGNDKWYPAWDDPKASLGESYSMKMKGKGRLWGVVERASMIRTFNWPTMRNATTRAVMLPMSVRRYFKLGTPAEGGEVNLGDNAAQHASNTGVAIDPTKAQVVGGGQRGGGARQSTAMSCDDGGREEPNVVTQSTPQGRLLPLQNSQRVKSANISPANVVSMPTELRPRRRHLRPRKVRLDDSKGHPPQR